MGFLDAFFGNNVTPTVSSILPDAAKQEILAGRLPRLNTDNLFLKKGEYCCYIDKALLLEEKTRKRYKSHSVSMPGLFKGNRHSFGSAKPQEYTEILQHKAILYITNQRIILQCKDHGFDKPYKNLSAVNPYSNGIELQYGSKTYSLIVPDGVIPYEAIKIIQQRRSIY